MAGRASGMRATPTVSQVSVLVPYRSARCCENRRFVVGVTAHPEHGRRDECAPGRGVGGRGVAHDHGVDDRTPTVAVDVEHGTPTGDPEVVGGVVPGGDAVHRLVQRAAAAAERRFVGRSPR